jgi:endogenous inhibitor of DNA gyrase (YacG/DUF329 family)
MRCPICNKETPYEGNPDRPFCSELCRLLDLDNWLSQRYRISTPVETESLDQTLETGLSDEGTKGKRD